MAKPKVKLDFKELLLKKGEYIALGVAGVGLVVLLLWGITTGAGAANPTEISKDLNTKSTMIGTRINDQNDPSKPDDLPESVRLGKKTPYIPVRPAEFAYNDAMLFDMVGKPETKRVNPSVYGIEDYQPDLVRGAMPGYDIIYVDGKDPQIAVRVEKKLDAQQKEALRDALDKLKGKQKRGQAARNQAQNQPGMPGMPPPPGGRGPGGGGPGRPPGSGGPPPGSGGGPPPGLGSGGGPPPGLGGGGGPPPLSGGGGLGGGNSSFDASAARTEIGIVYVPLDELDKAMDDGKLPAQTVIPLRMIVINFTIPLKKQAEEMKKAMRLQTLEQARSLVAYDGFEVQRKITQVRPTGEVVIVQDWAKYDYESKYIDLIFSRKLNDHFEGSDKSRLGLYLPYFYRYEDSLVMPLPELVAELGSYPPVKIKSILDTIDKLAAANTPKVDPSEVMKRIGKKGPRRDIFSASTAAQSGADGLFGGVGGGKGPLTPPGKGGNIPGGGGSLDNQSKVEIEHLLGRFVDCDVIPGLSYEYKIQLRMVNPNYGPNQLPYVSNPQDTKKQILFSPWVPLAGSLAVPAEEFLFAADRGQYVSDTAESFKGQSNLLKAMQAKDNQAVVQKVKWMESIRMEGKHEPIGGWVVAEMPVARGEYIGKKTFVKLPLWSSEKNQYVFREISAGAVKGKDQPKGWLVDFSSKSVLVDYEGGKVNARVGSRYLPTEEVATEMLILRADGKLAVRRSADDTADETRQGLTANWDAWLKTVDARPTTSAGSDVGNQFERPK